MPIHAPFIDNDISPGNRVTANWLNEVQDYVYNTGPNFQASLAANTGSSLIGDLDPAGNARTIAQALDLNFYAGNATAVPGVAMQIERLMESSTFQLKDEASIWSGRVRTFVGVNKEFFSGEGDTFSPLTSFTAMALNNNSGGEVCAGMFIGISRTNGDTAFGLNVIAHNSPGNTGTKLIGMEIDVEPVLGTTVDPYSAGLYINAFNVPSLGTALQTGAISGGSWTNGIILYGISSTGTGLGAGTAANMDSLINASAGNYNTAAIILGNNQSIMYGGVSAGQQAFTYMDSSNNWLFVNGSGAIAFRNHTNTVSLVTIQDAGSQGVLDIDTPNGEYRLNGTRVVGSRRPGWATTTGTLLRTNFGDASLSDTSQALRALITDLKSHGLIGS